MNNMNHGLRIYAVCCLTALLLSGCFFTPVKTPVSYYIEVPEITTEQVIPARIAVQAVDGRSPYRKRRITVSPRPYVQGSYSLAQWFENPCDMYTESIISYLSRKTECVSHDTMRLNDSADWLIRTYIDVYDQVKRDDVWMAHTRVKYEIVKRDSSQVAVSEMFERKIPLQDGSVESYVAAQNRIFREFLEELTGKLKETAR